MFGGRGGTKSQTIADVLIYKAYHEGIRIGCFREYQNTLDDSVHALIKYEISRLQVPGFKVTDKYIAHENGATFKFKGLARNIGNVKSFFGFDIFWIEEGQFLSEQSIRTLLPTLREQDSELWISLNPENETDAVFERYIKPHYKTLLKDKYYEDDQLLVIWTNYDENPWFPDELELDRQHDYEHLPRNVYDHVWLGYCNPAVDNPLIETEWFDACIDAHTRLGFDPLGIKYVSFDPADTRDAKALSYRHGSVVLQSRETNDGDVNEACDWATDFAIQNDADAFIWDCDGLGVSLKRQISKAFEGKPILLTMFKGSEKPDNPEATFQFMNTTVAGDGITPRMFNQKKIKDVIKNKRAQYYYDLRLRVYTTYRAVRYKEYHDPDEMISFSLGIDDLQALRSEMCSMPLKPNSSGLFELYTKSEMKTKFKLPSLNLADTSMMFLKTPQLHQTTSTIRPPAIRSIGRGTRYAT